MNEGYYNTKFLLVKDNKKEYYSRCYCVYCGKEMERASHYHCDDREEEVFYHCNCEMAQKEHEINFKVNELRYKLGQEIAKLQSELPKENFKKGDCVKLGERGIEKITENVVKIE